MKRIALVFLLSVSVVSAQTKISPPENKYAVADDVKLGREAAEQAREQLPLMRDERVTDYVEDLGRRLVAAIPPEQRHDGFDYSFDVVNVREINAFALPGGPMFVNRGMLEAARSEGEIAGVLAHEISHVTLRHGTAQASKATPYQLGEIAGAVVGAIVGGTLGKVISTGTSFGLGTAFMRFGREYERQADLQGAQIMAQAGYDPRDMARMFETLAKQGGSGPEWLSDHPNPDNRSAYINKEAQALQVTNPVRDTAAFEGVRAHLRTLPKAPTTEEAMRTAKRGGSSGRRTGTAAPTGRVQPPSSRYTQYNEGNVFRVSVPSNWRELEGGNAVTFAPDGAYGTVDGQNVFTHGVEIGLARNERKDLRTATDELIASLGDANPRLARRDSYRRATVSGREGLQTTLTNVSEVTRQPEVIQLVTTFSRDGSLLYAIAVAPESDFRAYQPHFQRVIRSIQLQ